MSDRRVVVTGIGLISPLGFNSKDTWQNIISSKSGISKIENFDCSKLPSKIAGCIDLNSKFFNLENFIEPRNIRIMDDFIKLAMVAATEAMEDSEFIPIDDQQRLKAGVLIGSGIGGLKAVEKASVELHHGNGKVSPFFIPSALINLAAGHVSIKYNLMGPNHAVATACASGTHAIGDAFRLIKNGNADFMLAGGTESAVCHLGVAGFCAAKALSTSYNDMPEKASRPWDKGRDGFVISEGAAIISLEEYESAKKRGAKIYAEVLGYGLSGDAHHITAPHPEGIGAMNAMKSSLEEAKLNPTEIGYINAHGTSTPVGDLAELNNVQKLFYENLKNVKMSSTKSSIGHLLGAAGAVEAVFTILALKNQIIPPTLNLDDPEDDVIMDLVPNIAKDHKFEKAMSNSFGFGGTNATLTFGKI